MITIVNDPPVSPTTPRATRVAGMASLVVMMKVMIMSTRPPK